MNTPANTIITNAAMDANIKGITYGNWLRHQAGEPNALREKSPFFNAEPPEDYRIEWERMQAEAEAEDIDLSELLTRPQIAAMIGLGKQRTADVIREAGIEPAFKQGRSYYYTPESVEPLLTGVAA